MKIAGKPLLRRAVTVVAVFVLAAVLTFVRHNESGYLTGMWDPTSQLLVFGRMDQMMVHREEPGGFMGVYAQTDEQEGLDRQSFRDNDMSQIEGLAYRAYDHQSGLQGTALGIVNKVYSLWQPDGAARETMLYATNSILFYAVELFIGIAVWHTFGLLPAFGWLLAVLLAPWLQTGMKNLYWCLWTWLLPLLAALVLCRAVKKQGRAPAWCYLLLAAACAVRCMCGFEYISTFLILCEIPLCYCAVQTAAEGDRPAAWAWFKRIVLAGLAALGGVAAALLVWLAQLVASNGGFAAAWQQLSKVALIRMSITDDDVRDVTIPQVLHYYFLECEEPLLQIGPLRITVLPLLLAVVAAGLAAAVVLHKRGRAWQLAAPAVLWLLSLAAPVSWMVLSKAHASIHTHLTPMLWHFAFVPVSCMLLVWLVQTLVQPLLSGRKKELVASH